LYMNFFAAKTPLVFHEQSWVSPPISQSGVLAPFIVEASFEDIESWEPAFVRVLVVCAIPSANE
jgi:hypothetical protein